MILWMGLKLKLIIDTKIIKFIISRLVQVGVCWQPAQAGAGAAHPHRLQQQPGRRLRAWWRGCHRQQPGRDGRQLGRALDQRLLGPTHPGHEVTQVIPPPHGPHIQVSTHYLHIIYATSTHYLHTIVLATSHPGQQREEGPRGHFNSALIPHHLFWLYFIWFRIHGRYLQHYNLASWEPPICENLEKRLLCHTINVTENNKNHWH